MQRGTDYNLILADIILNLGSQHCMIPLPVLGYVQSIVVALQVSSLHCLLGQVGHMAVNGFGS